MPAVPPDPARVKRLLVRSTNWIGDVVMISPALRALRRRFTGARIEIVAIPGIAPCYEGNPDIDEVIVFDRRGRDSGAMGLLRLARKLRGRRYDVAVLFQKAIGAALGARLAGIPVRIGLDTDRRGWLLTHTVPFTEALARRHHLEIFSTIALAAGCESVDPNPFFPVSDEDHKWAERYLEEQNAASFSFLMALHTGASKPPRAWHLDRFAEVARRVAGRHGAAVVLLGGPGDVADMKTIADRLGEHAINACGGTTLGQMAALIARCRVFLGNDSGPMHVAGALGVPVVAIFGPGDPTRTAAWSPALHGNGSLSGPAPGAESLARPVAATEAIGGSSATTGAIGRPAASGALTVDRAPASPAGHHAAPVLPISRRYPCAPCRQAFFRECYPAPSGKPMCLESIGVDEVEAAVDRALGT